MVSTMAVRSRTHCASCAVASCATATIEITSSSGQVFMSRAVTPINSRRALERNEWIRPISR